MDEKKLKRAEYNKRYYEKHHVPKKMGRPKLPDDERILREQERKQKNIEYCAQYYRDKIGGDYKYNSKHAQNTKQAIPSI